MPRKNQPMGPGDWEGVWVFIVFIVIVVLLLMLSSSYHGRGLG